MLAPMRPSPTIPIRIAFLRGVGGKILRRFDPDTELRVYAGARGTRGNRSSTVAVVLRRDVPSGTLGPSPSTTRSTRMGIGGFFRKQFIDVIQWTESEQGVLAWRFPMADMEIQNGASLTVRESQLAVF